jgi:hypothetical protein
MTKTPSTRVDADACSPADVSEKAPDVLKGIVAQSSRLTCLFNIAEGGDGCGKTKKEKEKIHWLLLCVYLCCNITIGVQVKYFRNILEFFQSFGRFFARA